MWSRLRAALEAITHLPTLLQHLIRVQREQNRLLRELITARTQHPPLTEETEEPDLTTPPPFRGDAPAPRTGPRTEADVFVETREDLLQRQIAQDAKAWRETQQGRRIV